MKVSGDLLVGVGGGVQDAVAEVLVDKLGSDAIECAGDRADLGDHVDAVLVVDHALQPADLAFDLAEPSEAVVLVEGAERPYPQGVSAQKMSGRR